MAEMRPRDGDLVLTVVVHAAEVTRRYALAQVPGRPQASWLSRDRALDVALVYARRHAVDVWISDGPFTARVATCRPARAQDTIAAEPA